MESARPCNTASAALQQRSRHGQLREVGRREPLTSPILPCPLHTFTWNPRLRGTGQTQQTWPPLRHLRVGQVCGEDVHKLRGRLSRDTPAPTPRGIRTKAWWGAMWRAWCAALAEGQLGSLAGTQLWGRHGWVCYITICKKREERKRRERLRCKNNQLASPAQEAHCLPVTL